ncbi:MAG: polysaccharide biosynthesis protein, partial [Planctomyces sp.]|nr:polysaccharide biosynthesis protein [Planctomyces sp.]
MMRLAIAVCCYAAVFAASLLTALLLRFDFVLTDYAREVFADSVLIVVLLKIAVVLISRDWHRRLRYSTFYDLVWSAAVCIVSGIIIAALQIARETMPQIPRSVIANDTMISVAALASLRVLANSIRTQINLRRGPRAQRALIYASGADAISLLTAIQAGSSLLKVVGIVSPKRLNGPTLVGGVPVISASEGLSEITRRTRAEHLLMPSNLSGRTVREVTEACLQIGLESHLVPAVDEIHSDRFQLRTREVTIDDLLRRDPNQLDMNGIRSVIRNKVVLVTGAAGSIGSEVCRQLLQFEPRKLILLDQSEFGIFELEREIQNLVRSLNRPAPTVEFILEDIADEKAMSRIFMVQRPSVIFHAAAYKHVPLMESNPQAAVRNNVFGTRTLVDLANRFAVERFVMISTDKAVRPTNVMGATKLIAEHYLN